MMNDMLGTLFLICWCRNFCHMAEISAISLHDFLFWLVGALYGRYAQYKKDAEFQCEYSDLEISGIWQKFLPFFRNFFNSAISGARTKRWWIWKVCGILFSIFWPRNFWHIVEISAIFAEIPYFGSFWSSKGKMANAKKMRNSISHILI